MRFIDTTLAAGIALLCTLAASAPVAAQGTALKPSSKVTSAATYVYCAALASQLDADDGGSASQAYRRAYVYAKRAALQAVAPCSLRSVEVDNAILEQFSSLTSDAIAAESLGRKSLRAAGGRFDLEFREVCMPVLQFR